MELVEPLELESGVSGQSMVPRFLSWGAYRDHGILSFCVHPLAFVSIVLAGGDAAEADAFRTLVATFH